MNKPMNDPSKKEEPMGSSKNNSNQNSSPYQQGQTNPLNAMKASSQKPANTANVPPANLQNNQTDTNPQKPASQIPPNNANTISPNLNTNPKPNVNPASNSNKNITTTAKDSKNPQSSVPIKDTDPKKNPSPSP